MSETKPFLAFQGVMSALVTPFKNGLPDFAAYEALIEGQIEAGIAGVIPVGTTGETSTLSVEEHKSMVTRCIEIVRGRIRVLAGAGSNNTSEAIELAAYAKAKGADGVLVVAPYYNKPSQEGLYQHYKAINDAVQIPIVLYNVPSRTVVDLATTTVVRLSALPNIVGIKDATGDLERLSLMRNQIEKPFCYLSGDDASFLGYMAHGGHGVISVTSNLAPALMVALHKACEANDYPSARQIQSQLIDLHRALFADSSPAPAKYGLSRLGPVLEDVRLPLTPCKAEVRVLIDEALKKAGLLA